MLPSVCQQPSHTTPLPPPLTPKQNQHKALAPDTIPGVRLALAAACLDLAPKLGQEPFMRHLMPLLERALLPDPTHPDPVKVRLHVLQRLGVIGAWLPSLQDTFVPVLLQLRGDDNWRVRKAAVEALPVLGEHMDVGVFDQRLLPHLLSAFTVRDRPTSRQTETCWFHSQRQRET